MIENYSRLNTDLKKHRRLLIPSNEKKDHIYYLRGYKVVKILEDTDNLEFLMDLKKTCCQTILSHTADCLKREDPIPCINHIAKVLELFINKDPENSIRYLLQYNLLFFLSLHFDYQMVSNFFWDLLHPMEGKIHLSQKDLHLIWAYMKDTSFLIHLGKQMLEQDYEIPSHLFLENFNVDKLFHDEDYKRVIAREFSDEKPENPLLRNICIQD